MMVSGRISSPCASKLLDQHLAHIDIEAAQRQVAAQDQAGLDAEPVQDAGELDADVAGADHREPPGLLRHALERVVGGDRVLDAGKLGQAGPGADRDQDAIGGMGLAARLDRIVLPSPGRAP